MSTTTLLQIKLVAVADIHLKAGEEIDAQITIPTDLPCTKEVRQGLVMGVGSLNAVGNAAAQTMAGEER